MVKVILVEGIMRNISMKVFQMISGSEVISRYSYLELWQPLL